MKEATPAAGQSTESNPTIEVGEHFCIVRGFEMGRRSLVPIFSPELPLKLESLANGDWEMIDAKGRLSLYVWRPDALDFIRRIVASVNALSELTVEAIESLTPADILAAMQHKVAGERVERLEALRSRIVLAAKAVLDAGETTGEMGNWFSVPPALICDLAAAISNEPEVLSPAPAPSEEEQV